MPRTYFTVGDPKAMSLADFATAVDAPPRWCQNALQSLGRPFRYDWDAATRLGLARLLQQKHGVPLAGAMRVAEDALRAGFSPIVREDASYTVTAVVVDVPRYLTEFMLRAARLHADPPRRRGRPRRAPASGGIAAGQAYGLDVNALKIGLRHSAAERLHQLDANQGMIAALRRGPKSP